MTTNDGGRANVSFGKAPKDPAEQVGKESKASPKPYWLNSDGQVVESSTGNIVSIEQARANLASKALDDWAQQSRKARAVRIAKLVVDEDEDLRHLKGDPGNSLIRISLDELRHLIVLGIERALKEAGR